MLKQIHWILDIFTFSTFILLPLFLLCSWIFNVLEKNKSLDLFSSLSLKANGDDKTSADLFAQEISLLKTHCFANITI